MSLTIGIVIGLLIAAGIILVWEYLSVSSLIKKLKEKHSDFFKAYIKKNYKKHGIPIVTLRIEDIHGNTIANESYAGVEGMSDSLYTGRTIYKE